MASVLALLIAGICNPSMRSGIFPLNLEVSKLYFMKKFMVLSLLLAAFVFSSAQTTGDPLQLKEAEHDFSMIPQGKPVYYTFELINNGQTAITLNDVHATCGCTTPEWSREPIAPGATAKIKVGYNAAMEGSFEKFITITYNQNQTKQLKITGTVWKAPEGSAPANAAVQFFKKQPF